MCMCLSHLSCLCFNVVGLFVLMHCSIFFFRLFCCCFHFHFVSACVGVFCFQFSLPITKYFVCFCFAYNWMFCLRSHIHSTKVIFFFCVSFFFSFVDGVFFYDHCQFTAYVCVLGVLVTHSLSARFLNIWINVLDFSLLFNDFFFAQSARVQEFCFSILFFFCSYFSTIISFSLSMLLLL